MWSCSFYEGDLFSLWTHITLPPGAPPEGQLRLVWVKAARLLQWKLSHVSPPSLGGARLRALLWGSVSSLSAVLFVWFHTCGQPRARGRCSCWRSSRGSQVTPRFHTCVTHLFLTPLLSILSSHSITGQVSAANKIVWEATFTTFVNSISLSLFCHMITVVNLLLRLI